MKKRKDNRTRLCCLGSCLLAMITEGVTVASSLLMGDAIDLSIAGQLANLLQVCVEVLLLTIISNLFFSGSVCLNQIYGQTTGVQLRDTLMHSFFTRGIFRFRRKNDAYYINLLGRDVDQLCDSYYINLSTEIKFASLLLASIIAMTLIHAALFAVALVFSLLPLLVTWRFEKRLQKRTEISSKASEQFQQSMLQMVQGYEMLKLNCRNLEGAEHCFHLANRTQAKARVQAELLQSVSYLSIDTINTIGQLVLLSVGGYLIVVQKITAGQLMSCTILTTYVCMGMNNFLEIHMARKSMKPILQKVEDEQAADPAEDYKPEWTPSDYSVCYDHVSFGFPGQESLFRDISFQLESEKCYAVVGESGRGKSTLVRLMLKYYPDYQGTITVCGHDVRHYAEPQLYQLVGLLNQGEYIMNASLFDNIALYSDHLSRDSQEYAALLEQVNLSSLAARVGDKPLGDFGDELSGGERQRIALARVLARKPKILIFDEPTAGLDPENREAINRVIFNLRDMTRIVITHDLTPEYLSQFQRVFYLEQDGNVRTGNSKEDAQ